MKYFCVFLLIIEMYTLVYNHNFTERTYVVETKLLQEELDSQHTTIATHDEEKVLQNIRIDLCREPYVALNQMDISNANDEAKNAALFPETTVLSSHQKQKPKQNVCFYCGIKFSKIVLHLERKHFNEKEVESFINLPKGSTERKHKIDFIRREGNFKHNQKKNVPLIVCRRPARLKIEKGYYTPCPNCKGYFAKNSIRKHFRACSPGSGGGRTLLQRCRQVEADVHTLASAIVRNEIFPPLRDDVVTRTLRHDELVIAYANHQALRYKSKHHYPMIRARLRLIGRYILGMRELDITITDLASTFNPIVFDHCITVIKKTGKFIEDEGKFKTPAVAFNLGTLLKEICNILISYSIKKRHAEKKKDAKDFLKLLSVNLMTAINKTVQENQMEEKRQKKFELPLLEDILALRKYVNANRQIYCDKLQHTFTFSTWKNLASFTLISLQLFNRRRPGEIERTLINDFRSYQGMQELTEEDEFASLSEASKLAAQRYVRFTIRGKLGREVPVLVEREALSCIDLLLEYRKEAKVEEKNPFVFGLPGNKYLRACDLMRQYSTNCGAKFPLRLRATALRKHVATQFRRLDLEENQVKELARFLGHSDNIHHDYYRQPVITREVTILSGLLEKTLGENNNESAVILPTEKSEEEEVNEDFQHNTPQQEVSIIPVSTAPPESQISFLCIVDEDGRVHTPTELNLMDLSEQTNADSCENDRTQDTSHVSPQPEFDNGSTSGDSFTSENKTANEEEFISNRKPRWKQEDVEIIQREFKKNIESNSYPSRNDIYNVLRKHPQLQNRTPKKIKSKIQHLKKLHLRRRLYQ